MVKHPFVELVPLESVHQQVRVISRLPMVAVQHIHSDGRRTKVPLVGK
jgi:hypothetical protein